MDARVAADSSTVAVNFGLEVAEGKGDDFLLSFGVLADDGFSVLLQDSRKISVYLSYQADCSDHSTQRSLCPKMKSGMRGNCDRAQQHRLSIVRYGPRSATNIQ